MTKAFVIDVALCSGCYSCQIACKDEHCGNDWRPYSAPQPDTGQFWIKVNEKPCGTIPKVRVVYTPVLCNHCASPACIAACKNGAIFKRDDGLVLIDPGKCKGCADCAKACPYGAIYENEALGIAQKCSGCAHLLDNGYAEPRCVEACPTGALAFGEEDGLAGDIKGAAVLKPETGSYPKVYYRNVPGQFIAGTAYDPELKEVIEHAEVVAVTGGKILRTWTDDFGDFWLNDLAVGSYDVTIAAAGYEPKNFSGLRTDECVNLGDIPLAPKVG
ncbi:MAG: carboxypeptidase regulatory-like domain-containing protein [Clostridiales Family XIII bacterium]|jgi:Fe-S-cluster-containing dehydrogenase component|nr:carboxypeptidase regulatory-like domain-containing protein [Clostridiales Family XIII bacterium]